jgi:hypothetical protein
MHNNFKDSFPKQFRHSHEKTLYAEEKRCPRIYKRLNCRDTRVHMYKRKKEKKEHKIKDCSDVTGGKRVSPKI